MDRIHSARDAAARIKAVVERDASELIVQPERTAAVELLLYVENDPTTGVDAATVDVGGDRFRIAVRAGEEATKVYRIRRINNQDAAGLELVVA